MKVAIFGSRGIPNRYGGFEQFAERLAIGLVQKDIEVWVYNAHHHPCRDAVWNGVGRIFCHDPEQVLGQAGQFIYDWNCISHMRRQSYDLILQLGYTSSSVWHWRMPRGPVVVTNMDGLEWSRRKYSPLVRRFLLHAERLAVRNSHHLVADSTAIADYLSKTYGADATFIPYGADIPQHNDPAILRQYQVDPGRYFLAIARLQPDNHIEEIIGGVLASAYSFPLLIVGCTRSRYGRYLLKKHQDHRVIFVDGLFDKEALDVLRSHAALYFHGHSAGGTNPSLLEAMAAGALVCAHDNAFNRAVLGHDACYFNSSVQIKDIIDSGFETIPREEFLSNNLGKIKNTFSWDKVVDAYLGLFKGLLGA